MRSPARSWWLAVTAVVSLSSMKAQTAVHSTFINRYPNHYSEPSNWSPAQVPNNTADTLFDVTVNAGSIGLAVDLDATISNLRLLGMDARKLHRHFGNNPHGHGRDGLPCDRSVARLHQLKREWRRHVPRWSALDLFRR